MPESTIIDVLKAEMCRIETGIPDCEERVRQELRRLDLECERAAALQKLLEIENHGR